MTLLQAVKSFINHRLSVVAEEIFSEVERTIREYEDQDVYFKQQIKQQCRKLELLQPVIKLHRAG